MEGYSVFSSQCVGNEASTDSSSPSFNVGVLVQTVSKTFEECNEIWNNIGMPPSDINTKRNLFVSTIEKICDDFKAREQMAACDIENKTQTAKTRLSRLAAKLGIPVESVCVTTAATGAFQLCKQIEKSYGELEIRYNERMSQLKNITETYDRICFELGESQKPLPVCKVLNTEYLDMLNRILTPLNERYALTMNKVRDCSQGIKFVCKELGFLSLVDDLREFCRSEREIEMDRMTIDTIGESSETMNTEVDCGVIIGTAATRPQDELFKCKNKYDVSQLLIDNIEDPTVANQLFNDTRGRDFLFTGTFYPKDYKYFVAVSENLSKFSEKRVNLIKVIRSSVATLSDILVSSIKKISNKPENENSLTLKAYGSNFEILPTNQQYIPLIFEQLTKLTDEIKNIDINDITKSAYIKLASKKEIIGKLVESQRPIIVKTIMRDFLDTFDLLIITRDCAQSTLSSNHPSLEEVTKTMEAGSSASSSPLEEDSYSRRQSPGAADAVVPLPLPQQQQIIPHEVNEFLEYVNTIADSIYTNGPKPGWIPKTPKSLIDYLSVYSKVLLTDIKEYIKSLFKSIDNIDDSVIETLREDTKSLGIFIIQVLIHIGFAVYTFNHMKADILELSRMFPQSIQFVTSKKAKDQKWLTSYRMHSETTKRLVVPTAKYLRSIVLECTQWSIIQSKQDLELGSLPNGAKNNVPGLGFFTRYIQNILYNSISEEDRPKFTEIVSSRTADEKNHKLFDIYMKSQLINYLLGQRDFAEEIKEFLDNAKFIQSKAHELYSNPLYSSDKVALGIIKPIQNANNSKSHPNSASSSKISSAVNSRNHTPVKSQSGSRCGTPVKKYGIGSNQSENGVYSIGRGRL